MKMHALVAAAATTLLLAGCIGQNYDDEGKGQPQPEPVISAGPAAAPASEKGDSAPPADDGGHHLNVAGVHFHAPGEWRDLGASGMRQASFQLPAAGDDERPAELNFFFFGTGQGGDIEANIQRWVGQMQGEPEVERSELENENGMPVHLVDARGTFVDSMGGGPFTGGEKVEQPNSLLVGAIVEGPQGNIFLKLTGPETTALLMREGLVRMLRGAGSH